MVSVYLSAIAAAMPILCFSSLSLWRFAAAIDWLRKGRPPSALKPSADWRLAFSASLYRLGFGTSEGLLDLWKRENIGVKRLS